MSLPQATLEEVNDFVSTVGFVKADISIFSVSFIMSATFINASGSSWDIGHTVGDALRDKLQPLKSRVDGSLSKLPRDELKERLDTTRRYTEEHVLLCSQELKGMAEGSGVPYMTLLAVNSLQELLFEGGCSSFAVPQGGSINGHVLLGHNEDNSPHHRDCICVVKCTPDEEPAYVAFAYSGMLLHQGFNERGVGSVGNALYANDLKPGVPKLFAYREIMRTERVEDAIRVCIRPERANGNNHVVADRDGEIYDVEVSGTRYGLSYAGNGFMAHTNHHVHPDMAGLDGWADLLNSRVRLNRLSRLLEEGYGGHTAESLTKLLSDHANYPRSLCKHIQEGVNETVCTVGSVVIDLTEGRLMYKAGNPCAGGYSEAKLDLL
ncbi:hypothetical protein JXL21_06400 [Candidatus Bathyarchaeota archaeon]|nr:hypothetical protein [Candidatus Bathyarchaeota archaeon]